MVKKMCRHQYRPLTPFPFYFDPALCPSAALLFPDFLVLQALLRLREPFAFPAVNASDEGALDGEVFTFVVAGDITGACALCSEWTAHWSMPSIERAVP